MDPNSAVSAFLTKVGFTPSNNDTDMLEAGEEFHPDAFDGSDDDGASQSSATNESAAAPSTSH